MGTEPSFLNGLGQILAATEQVGLRLVQMRLVKDDGPAVVLQVAGTQAMQRWESASNSLPPDCVRSSPWNSAPHRELFCPSENSADRTIQTSRGIFDQIPFG